MCPLCNLKNILLKWKSFPLNFSSLPEDIEFIKYITLELHLRLLLTGNIIGSVSNFLFTGCCGILHKLAFFTGQRNTYVNELTSPTFENGQAMVTDVIKMAKFTLDTKP